MAHERGSKERCLHPTHRVKKPDTCSRQIVSLLLLSMQPLVAAWYWLALSTWFGAVLMSAIAPPVILRVIQRADPSLPRVLSGNLDRQHSTLLASDIVGELLAVLFRVQSLCAAVLFPALVAQWFLVDRTGLALAFPILVSGLFVGAVALLLYGWRSVWTKVMAHRAAYIENADDPEKANPELDEFDRYSNELSGVVRNLLFALLGIILFSVNFLPYSQSFGVK